MRRRLAPQGFGAGMTYMLIGPIQFLNGRAMGTRIRQAADPEG